MRLYYDKYASNICNKYSVHSPSPSLEHGHTVAQGSDLADTIADVSDRGTGGLGKEHGEGEGRMRCLVASRTVFSLSWNLFYKTALPQGLRVAFRARRTIRKGKKTSRENHGWRTGLIRNRG